MTREECEKKIAEYCLLIRKTMMEYNPDASYFNITFEKGINGNRRGKWDSYYVDANNAYFDDDSESPIHFHVWSDIKDDKYWACVTEEEDRVGDEIEAKNGNLLTDGSLYEQM